MDTSPKVLIIMASGGSGHIQAALAKKAQLLSLYSSPEIIIIDVITSWIGKRLGKIIALWNYAQKMGRVSILRCFYTAVPLCDFLFGPIITWKTYRLLCKHEIDIVIDTQIIGVTAVLRAVALASKKLDKHIRFEKVIVELPTSKTTPYFKPLKNIAPSYYKFLTLQAAYPMLGSCTSPKEFWKMHCGLPDTLVDMTSSPIRPAFLKNYAQVKKSPLHLSLSISEEQHLFLQTILSKSSLSFSFGKMHLQSDEEPLSSYAENYTEDLLLEIPTTAHVTTLMLGTFPTITAVKHYVSQYIRLCQEIPAENERLLFVFCSHKNAKNPLLDYLQETISAIPGSTLILPLYFQDDSVIAPLLARSQITITRSGAITSHELLNTATGNIFIHSECKTAPFTQERMKRFMPLWEEGNAEYLAEKKGARILTPSTFMEEIRPLLKTHVESGYLSIK